MQPSRAFLVWLAGLSVLGFLATDMYLPAFSVMQHSLSTSPVWISASLSLYLAGFALAQLVWGPLSDRLGRRPVLLAGLALFALGCLGMLWVENAVELLVLRFMQATGVCAAAVIWPALVADHYPAHQRNRVFATIMPLVGLSPALAPLVGSWLLQHFEWQAIFVTLLAITLMLMVPAQRLPPRTARPAAGSGEKVSFRTLFNHASYRGNVLIYAACSASFFAWLTGSPFILSRMGYGPGAIGLSYVPQTLAFLAGGYSCRAALKRWQGSQMLPWLLAGFTLSVAITWAVALVPDASLAAILTPFCVMALVNGAIYPLVVSAALAPFPQASGRATALQNTLQLGLCFAASLVVSSMIEWPLLTTTSVMLLCAGLALIGYAIRVRAAHLSHVVSQ